jgi:hypothetical protein
MAPGKLNTPRFLKLATPEIRDLTKLQLPFKSIHDSPLTHKLPGSFAPMPTQLWPKKPAGAIKLSPSESAKLIKRFNTKRTDIN